MNLRPGSNRPPGRPTAGPLIYPRYFLAGIAITLTAGAGWGAWLLLGIASERSFAAASGFAVNAHGQAQIYGWMGLFILGFAYQMFPGLWRTPLVAPRLAAAVFPILVAAIAVRTVAEAWGPPRWDAVAIAAGGVELLAIAVFVAQLLATERRRRVERIAADRYLVAGLVWFLAGAALDLVHLVRTQGAASPEVLRAAVATWQPALRDVQIFGIALSLILGVSLRLLPGLLGTPPASESRARRLFWPLQGALAARIVLAPLTSTASPSGVGLGFWLATVLFAALAVLAAANLRVFERPRFVLPRVSPLAFVRAAHVWLAVSLAMMVAAPLWTRALGAASSHAWQGATRHAVTVGFISLMIVAVASRLPPRPPESGFAGTGLPVATFLLLNVGCALRVSQQVLTDVAPVAFLPAGASGLLELAGLTWWATWIVPRLLRAARGLPAGAPATRP